MILNNAREQHKQYFKERQLLDSELALIQCLDRDNSYESHPDLLCIYKPEIDCGLVYCVETFKPDVKCDNCGVTGSYVMSNEDTDIGLCKKELFEGVEIKTSNFMRIIPLPKNHKYGCAESLEL